MIKNRLQLIENGSNNLFKKLRNDACDIFESALNSVDPKQAVYNALKLEKNVLLFEKGYIDLNAINQIFVIGGGKAGGMMSLAIEELLGDHITSGIVNVLEGTSHEMFPNHITLNEASHPIPSQSGINGVKMMLELTTGLKENDLIITLISGGGSALMPLPAHGIKLEDIQEITNKLLKAGANINELNSVRKHLSSFKGGQLARHCYPAQVLSLILSDVINDPLDTIASGPTVPDDSSYENAFQVLENYGIYKKAPKQVKQRIEKGLIGAIPENPKKDDPIFERVYNILIANNLKAAQAAKRKAEELSYNSKILSTSIEGEARQVATQITEIINEISLDNYPQKKPLAFILGGETTVTVKGSGIGGRNQELVLAALLDLSCNTCLLATLGTDGIDGPTAAAGALVDGASLNRAKNLFLDPDQYLENNDSYNFFYKIKDNIITGPTGTNVNDLILLLVT
jgi:glycerate-2-kinase